MSKATLGKASGSRAGADRASVGKAGSDKPGTGRSSGDPVAQLYLKIRNASSRAGSILHDDVGPLLSAAGLHLQLLRMDHPGAASTVQQVTDVLDQAIDRIRAISQQLEASPVARGGLHRALTQFAKTLGEQHPGTLVELDYQATAVLPEEAACALYDAAAGALAQAVGPFAAKQIKVSVSGSRSLSIRITDNGRARGRATALREIHRLARASGIETTVRNQTGYTCLVRYAFRRSGSRRS